MTDQIGMSGHLRKEDMLVSRVKDLTEARADGFAAGLEAAAKVAKSAWLTTNIGTIGDAEYGEALCHELSNTIRALNKTGTERKENKP